MQYDLLLWRRTRQRPRGLRRSVAVNHRSWHCTLHKVSRLRRSLGFVRTAWNIPCTVLRYCCRQRHVSQGQDCFVSQICSAVPHSFDWPNYPYLCSTRVWITRTLASHRLADHVDFSNLRRTDGEQLGLHYASGPAWQRYVLHAL